MVWPFPSEWLALHCLVTLEDAPNLGRNSGRSAKKEGCGTFVLEQKLMN